MTSSYTLSKRFRLGRLVITADADMELHPLDVRNALARHACGDWGEIDYEIFANNESALQKGGLLFSCYRDRYQSRFRIITEPHHSQTTILLPEEC